MVALPIPSLEQQVHSQLLRQLIQQAIIDCGGWLSFAEFMHMALYTSGLGYYSGGLQKFADTEKGAGDFVTAPEISPLFAQSIARQAAQILTASQGNILELGAGTGKLAADLLLELQALHALPDHYYILDVSDHLRQVQHETLKNALSDALFNRVVWLEKLPENFVGLILANEVLDALPVHLIYSNKGDLFERGLAFEGDLVWQDKPLANKEIAKEAHGYCLPEQYLTEFCPAAKGLIHSLADALEVGAILLIDYGFSAREYYHPQRNQGTLMCHFQHYAHSNPLINIGLQDITAHVNFSQIANLNMAETHNGVSLAGYTTQAQFLMNCGILDIMAQHSPDSPQYMKLASSAQKLLSPAEMGELFKVIAFTKNFDAPLLGFLSGDKAHTL
ncbi:MAG: class I SAM-dependent methyltransferase [Methylophilaceae bacterium]